MKVLAYFSFTLLSIFIQFSVMDYLEGNDDKGVDLNLTSPKTRSHDIIKDLGFIPHALYYNTQKNNDMNSNDVTKKVHRNTLLPDKQQYSTDTPSTLDDILYDNTSITESDFTTDFEYTSIGFDNVTEMTLFVPKNETNIKSDKTRTINYNLDCNCNLLYEACDINCCCDSDCDNSLKEMFNCTGLHERTRPHGINDFCFSPLSLGGKSQSILDNMFCIVKNNLPEHRKNIKSNYVGAALSHKYLKWQQNKKPKGLKEFSKMQYKIGDPVWLLQNTSINHMNLPTSMVNNYCAGRKPIIFLKDEVISCIVKYKDLEMFRILKTAEESTVISPKNITTNSTAALNCTTLHCANWTIFVNDGVHRVLYNKEKHEPICNKQTCTNIALNIDYLFYYHHCRLANVSVMLHIRNISSAFMFMSQRIRVRFLLGNKTDEQTLEFSGSPGYRKGLMLVVSSSESNYTDNFYQSKISQEKYLSLPTNVNGRCVPPNSKHNFIKFGFNKRIKCRYSHNRTYNNVNVCDHIQGNISKLFRLHNKTFVSPYGNPYNLKDEDWIHLRLDNVDTESVFGKLDTSLHCYNLISKISLTFVFMNVNEEENNTILSLHAAVSTTNMSFSTSEDISTVITMDINFVNVSERPTLEYAGRPRFNINIPRDFFFSHPSNNCNENKKFMFKNVFIYYCVYMLLLFTVT